MGWAAARAGLLVKWRCFNIHPQMRRELSAGLHDLLEAPLSRARLSHSTCEGLTLTDVRSLGIKTS
jgi:hypothetical protein